MDTTYIKMARHTHSSSGPTNSGVYRSEIESDLIFICDSRKLKNIVGEMKIYKFGKGITVYRTSTGKPGPTIKDPQVTSIG